MEEDDLQNVEKGLATWEEHRNIVRAFRDEMRKAKAHLELNRVREIRTVRRAALSVSKAK